LSKLTAEELVRRTINGAYTLALRLAGNNSDAWDLTQEALLRAIRGLPKFRGDSEPSTWVYRILINVWKNQTQSRTGRWWRSLLSLDHGNDPDDVSVPEPPSPELTPESSSEKAEERVGLDVALSRLAPEDRAALILRELDKKSYQEISDILDIPIGTVKSRIYRARKELAQFWGRKDAA
jgi:RNA polymerase sigma-70 factor (ECF subfamily)